MRHANQQRAGRQRQGREQRRIRLEATRQQIDQQHRQQRATHGDQAVGPDFVLAAGQAHEDARRSRARGFALDAVEYLVDKKRLRHDRRLTDDSKRVNWRAGRLPIHSGAVEIFAGAGVHFNHIAFIDESIGSCVNIFNIHDIVIKCH